MKVCLAHVVLQLVSVIYKNKEVSTGIGNGSAEAVANSVEEL